MKLICRIFVSFFIISNCWGSNQIVITYNHDTDRRDMVYEVLTEKLGLPENFISSIEDPTPCERRKDVVLQICINDNGEIFFPVARRDILRKSFKVFLKERK
jgi:hypothetical protein